MEGHFKWTDHAVKKVKFQEAEGGGSCFKASPSKNLRLYLKKNKLKQKKGL
jgi:hypothetical protein